MKRAIHSERLQPCLIAEKPQYTSQNESMKACKYTFQEERFRRQMHMDTI